MSVEIFEPEVNGLQVDLWDLFLAQPINPLIEINLSHFDLLHGVRQLLLFNVDYVNLLQELMNEFGCCPRWLVLNFVSDFVQHIESLFEIDLSCFELLNIEPDFVLSNIELVHLNLLLFSEVS
jgi:hypothetical protein